MILLAIPLGLLIGLLINALADNLPKWRSIGGPRCQRCGAPRPVAAWLGSLAIPLGSANCRYCASPMGWRPALVELGAVLGSAWLLNRDPAPSAFVPATIVLAIYLLIVVIDFEHRLILHIVTGPAAMLLLLIGILDPARGLVKTLLGGLAGFGLVLALYSLGGLFARLIARVRRQPLDEVAFGFGDVTLSAVIGLTVGWPGVIPALLVGVFAAGVFSTLYIFVMMLRRRYVAFTPIPYGPFLIFGALLVYFGGRALFSPLVSG